MTSRSYHVTSNNDCLIFDKFRWGSTQNFDSSRNEKSFVPGSDLRKRNKSVGNLWVTNWLAKLSTIQGPKQTKMTVVVLHQFSHKMNDFVTWTVEIFEIFQESRQQNNHITTIRLDESREIDLFSRNVSVDLHTSCQLRNLDMSRFHENCQDFQTFHKT